jgi:hypothetical protein
MLKKQIKIKDSINLSDQEHLIKLMQKLEQAYKTNDGWVIKNIDINKRIAFLENSIISNEKEQKQKEKITISLPLETKPSDANKIREFLEKKYKDTSTPYMLEFDAFKKTALLGNLSKNEFRVRLALATALSVKEWDIKQFRTTSKGYVFKFIDYMKNKERNDKKLTEAIEYSIGEVGWYFKVNYQTSEIEIIRAKLITFEKLYKSPLYKGTPKNDKELFRLPIGIRLGGAGIPNSELYLDLSQNSALVLGTAGSGKSVVLNNLIYQALSRGWQLAISDPQHKSVDYLWAKKFVKPYHFGGIDRDMGAKSRRGNLTVAKMIYEEGFNKRGQLLKKYGAKMWQELPEKIRKENPPILFIIDELTAQFSMRKKPAGLQKDDPIMIEWTTENRYVQDFVATVESIPAQLRFVGIRCVFATQVANTNTGISTQLRANASEKLLLGKSPSESQRNTGLSSPDTVPYVPFYIQEEDGQKGVGVAELDETGDRCVFKGFFGDTSVFEKELKHLSITHNPEPTNEQLNKYAPEPDV